MSSIAGYSFMSTHGAVPNLAGIQSEEITRPGITGKAFWATGIKAEPYVLRTRTACTNAAAVGNAVTAYKALESSLVTYVDDLGNSWYNQWVHRVAPVGDPIPNVGGTDPTFNYILECDWLMEHIAL